MTSFEIVALLQTALPGAQLESAESIDLQPTVYTSPADVSRVLRELRERPDLQFNFLAELTAADFWPREPRYELIYILVSLSHKLRLRLKVRLGADAARVPTATTIWPAANWLEREVWDLFGIEFEGHPDPRRLLMPEDWEGFPLRKDYPVQIRMNTDAGSPLQVTEEEFRANLEKDRLARK